MSRFAPARASSPRRSCIKPPDVLAQDVLDHSRTSVLSSVPELTGLTPEQIEFIDTVVKRASATSANFCNVFEAYNEVLRERGLDPQHEVTFYSKLLKLGTLKGKSWGEKWDMVKRQQRTSGVSKPASRPPLSRLPASRLGPPLSRAKVLSRLTGALKAIERDDDACTLTSRRDLTDDGASDAVTAPEADDTPRPIYIPRRSISPAFTANSLGLSTAPSTTAYQPGPSVPSYGSRKPYTARRLGAWDAETSDGTTDTGRPSSSVPPSYRAATRNTNAISKTSYTPLRALAQAHSRAASSNGTNAPVPHTVADSARAAVQQARQRRGSVLNEDDAWKKIKMAQDEEVADQFRTDKLVERCWDIWKQGLAWVITTNSQIAQARESLLVRKAFHTWSTRTAEYNAKYRRVAALFNKRCLKSALEVWKDKAKQKRQIKWRQDMRARMKTVRDNHDRRLVLDVWVTWKQRYRLEAANQIYYRRLLSRSLRMWKARKDGLHQLHQVSGQLISLREQSQMERCWLLWRRAMQLRHAENIMRERVALRIMTNVIYAWKRRLRESQMADQQYDYSVMKRTISSWKAARDRLRILDRKAAKHVARQNDVLVRAVWRVWKAHERGTVLANVHDARLLRRVWQKWQDRCREQRQSEDLATTFALRSSSVLATSSLQKWRKVYQSHRNAEAYAVRFYEFRLRFRVMEAWRLQWRAQIQQLKAARSAEKFLTMRKTWKTWLEKIADKRRDRQVVELQKRLLQRYFREWLQRSQAERQRKLLGDVMKQRVDLRIMTNALNHWTNRVADIKFRELEVAQQSDREVMAAAFKRWKDLCIRHVEELSLMESYQDVKREENMRRMFYRWLAAARKSRHRRLLLQEKEEQFKVRAKARAWDKWRERYLDIKLQPMADAFLIQSQQNLVFRAFGIWHSKSTSLPAIRFHASHLKAKYWKIWRDSMPKALQSKSAREVDRQAVLAKAFSKWTQAYKTKLELKAVARARYLRLPTAAPRQTGGPLLRNLPSATSSSRADDKQVTSSRSSTIDEPIARTRPSARPFPGRLGIASLLSERTRSPERRDRRTRPKPAPSAVSELKPPTRAGTTRAPSPALSTSSYGGVSRYSEPMSRLSALPGSGDAGRGRLWQEYRAIQRRTKTLTATTYSKDSG